MGRLNGQLVAGVALAFLAILFIYAGMVNSIWAVGYPAYFVLLAVGLGVIALGFWTAMNESKHPSAEHRH